MTTNDKATNDISQLLSSFEDILDLFKDLKAKVGKLETVIEGKPSENINSLYKDVQDVKAKANAIEEKLTKDILKAIETLRSDLDDLNTKNITIDTIKLELTDVKEKIKSVEMYKAERQGVEKFVTWIVPILSFLLAIAVNLFFRK